ncbi:MAG: hypothetical protein GX567_04585, partial [Clostridia bacterium]|nr:hypothetical protein [Clostridia bacterium]
MQIKTQVKKRLAGLLVLVMLAGMLSNDVYAYTLNPGQDNLGNLNPAETTNISENQSENPNQDPSKEQEGNQTEEQEEESTENQTEVLTEQQAQEQSISANSQTSVSDNQSDSLSDNLAQMDFSISDEELKMIEESLNYQDIDHEIQKVGLSAREAAKRAGIASVMMNEELPVSYSAVDAGRITSVKNQNPNGTCWAFSAINSMEASMIVNSDEFGYNNLDLSERHLAYFFYHTVPDPLGLTTGDCIEVGDGPTYQKDGYLQVGGNHFFTSMALSGWVSGADEAIAPYVASKSESEFKLDDSLAHNLKAHVQDVFFLNISEKDIVKQMIMDYGAVASSYYHDSSCLKQETGAYHESMYKDKSNHAISIVGWDDNYAVSNFNENNKPDNPGAWLIKNSWGTVSPLGKPKGYMWISYESPSLDEGFVYNASSASVYDKNYHYDGSAGTWSLYVKPQGSVANVFTTEVNTTKQELLKAVGVAFASPNVNYQIDIYTDLTNASDPTSGTKVASQTATSSYVGIYTIPLANPVLLAGGTTFSVVITNLSSDYVSIYSDMTYANGEWIKFTNQYAEGQSFYGSEHSGWHDYATSSSKGYTPRIKAFTSTIQQGEKSISECRILSGHLTTYNGQPQIIQNLHVYDGGKKLALNTDYIVEYFDNTNVGNASVKITGIGNYCGEVTEHFRITEASIRDAAITIDAPDKIYTGSPLKADSIVVEAFGRTLEENKDYQVSYQFNINIGEARVMIEGIGNYDNTCFYYFQIKPADLNKLVTVSFKDDRSTYDYKYEEICPEVIVTRNDGELILNETKDYTVTYSNNQNVGKATVTITGVGNYENTATKTFTIQQTAIDEDMIALEQDLYPYTTQAVKPSVTVSMNGHILKEGSDYTKSYANNINRSKEDKKASVIVKGIGNFKESASKTFSIGQADLDLASVTLAYKSIEWQAGKVYEPAVSAKYGTRTLIKNKDFTVTYVDNDKVGTAKVILRALDSAECDFIGTKESEFSILGKNVAKLKASLSKTSYLYQPELPEQKFEPEVVIKDGTKLLEPDVDYTVTYRNNVQAGYATAVVEGINNYSGRAELVYEIKGIDMNSKSLKYEPIAPKQYEFGNPIVLADDEIIVTDAAGTRLSNDNYTVAYANNTERGTASVYITGVGNYSGTKELKFKITPREFIDLSKSGKIEVSEQDKQAGEAIQAEYTGFEIKPLMKVTARPDGEDADQREELIQGIDYTVTYKNHIKAAASDAVKAPTIILTGKGNYKGTIEVKFSIAQPSILDQAVNFSVADVIYNKGKALTPKAVGTYTRPNQKGVMIPMSLVAGRDYTITYQDNTGKADENTTGTVTIHGIGNFCGTKEISFRIIHTCLAKDFVVTGINTQTFNGEPKEFDESVLNVYTKGKKVLLTKNVDYEISYENNTNAGTAVVLIKGINNYAGILKKTFKIKPCSLKTLQSAGILSIAEIADQIYT